MSDTFERVRDLIVQQLRCDPAVVTMSAPFGELMLDDSLDDVETIIAVEGDFDVTITDAEAATVVTVGDLVRLVERGQSRLYPIPSAPGGLHTLPIPGVLPVSPGGE